MLWDRYRFSEQSALTLPPPFKIKDEIVDADSFNAGDLSKVDEDKEARAARIITVTRSGQGRIV